MVDNSYQLAQHKQPLRHCESGQIKNPLIEPEYSRLISIYIIIVTDDTNLLFSYILRTTKNQLLVAV